ncbi:MAG: hypothetical protein KF819_08380 [Labilithrix sp.]|nr:hypothetical protein [Labilithrix sp.]
MSTVTERRRDPISTTSYEPAGDAAPATLRAPSASPDARLRQTIERAPVSTEYGAFLAQLRSPSSVHAELVSPTLRSSRDVAIQQRLDAFRDRFSGPYDIAGAKVVAPPMFRMNTPNSGNAAKAKAHAAELHEICARAGVASAAGPAGVGRPTPEQLVKVTQALLDAGKLPPPDEQHATLADRIRGMQWEWGIGVDCAGYTQQAAADAHGAAGSAFKANLTGDIFSGMMNDTRFTSVHITQIRPGDVIHLDSPKRGEVGHNVICRSHAQLDEATRARMFGAETGAIGKAFLAGKGPFHTFEVDSSWGAGNGSMHGGFRRDTWLFDESTFTWASYPAGDRSLPLHVDPMTGPQDELFGGAFRPKEER